MLHFNLPFLRERVLFFTINANGLLGIFLCCIRAHSPASCIQKGIEIKRNRIYNDEVYTTNDTLSLFIPTIKKPHHIFWILPNHRYAEGLGISQKFRQPGIQDIHVFTGICHYFRRVTVQPAIINTKDTTAIYPAIIGPGSVTVGTAATFGSNQPADVSFAWQLSGKEDSIYNTPTVTYTFRSPGEKILTLIVNRDTARMAVKRIHIFPPPILTSTPAPTAPAPPPIPHLPIKKVEPAVPSITAEEFRFMLQQVIYGNKQFTDFSEYLCNNIQTPVIINEKTMMPFNQFCLQIRGKKRLSIDQVNITRDKSGCITALNIQYNKKKFIGLF